MSTDTEFVPGEIVEVCSARSNEEDMFNLSPDHIFTQIQPGDKVNLKPNCVFESHKIGSMSRNVS